MNDRDTNPHTIGFTMNDRGPHDQRLLDMLVDGELADDQRRELLVRLNETPDGWRRCALAFLEAQSWRREMGVVVREPTGVVTIGGVTDFGASIGSTSCGAVANGHLDGRGIVAHATRRSSRAYFTPLAMAASFLVAFTLGLALRPAANRGASDASIGAVGSDFDPVHAPADNTFSVPGERTAEADDGTENSGTNGSWGTVKMVLGRGADGTLHEAELPAMEGASWDESLLASSSSVLSPELLELFERLGHEVRQERELVPVQLDDGRQMVVPVDKLSFTPVANRTYQ